MAFYSYIILDGYRYKTLAKQWRPYTVRAATARLTLLGSLEATFGTGTLKKWEGIISTPHGESSPGDPDGTLDGNIVTLRLALEKRQVLSFTDHNGIVYDVIAVGPFGEQTIQNVWNAASNKYMVQVQLTGKASA